MARTCLSLETSACTVEPETPQASTSAAVLAASAFDLEKLIATLAPSLASESDTARPMPVPPPVTSATLPFSFMSHLAPHSVLLKLRAAEFMQYRKPVGLGPSSNT